MRSNKCTWSIEHAIYVYTLINSVMSNQCVFVFCVVNMELIASNKNIKKNIYAGGFSYRFDKCYNENEYYMCT